jgi:Holliday junction resolvase
MTPEGKILSEIFEYLKMTGWLVLRINSGSSQPSVHFYHWAFQEYDKKLTTGVSDLIAGKDGKTLAIECKAPGKNVKPDSTQAVFLFEAHKHGWIPILATCVEDVQEVVAKLSEYAAWDDDNNAAVIRHRHAYNDNPNLHDYPLKTDE